MKEDPNNPNQTNDSKKSQSSRASANPYMKYSGMAFQLVGSIALGAWLGSLLDGKLQKKAPVFTIGLSLLFAIATLVLIIRELLKENK